MHEFGAARVVRPGSVDEVCEIVDAERRVGVVGAAHSFNDLADTDGVLLVLTGMAGVIELDAAAGTVTVGGGTRYHELSAELHAAGFALHNLPSVPHFSIVGACATATHGSGDGNGALHTAVRAVELVDGRGRVVTVGADDPDLAGAAVGLGAVGVVTALTLAIEPTFEVAQEVLLDLPLDTAVEHLDDLMASAYSVSLFTDWQDGTVDQVWRKHRLDEGTAPAQPEPLLGARPADVQVAPSGPANAHLTTPQGLLPGPWHERLPHVHPRRELQPGGELQSEYFVRRDDGRAAMEAVERLSDVLAPVIRTSEIRSVASDGSWASPFAGDSVALHFTWDTDAPAVLALLPTVEAALAAFAPLPHWGKLHTIPADVVAERCPRLRDLAGLAGRLDPDHVFRNRRLDALLG